jgi:fibronectin type 3 domain-containing protein
MSSVRRRLQIICASTILVFTSTAVSRAATLVWDPNPEPDIAGYNIHYLDLTGGTAGVWNAGLKCELALPLQEGHSYELYLRAYNQAGLQSDPSVTLRYTAPVSALLVTWDRSLDPALSSYTVHYGQLNQQAQSVTVGLSTSLHLTSLTRGASYYFYVSAMNASSNSIGSWRQVTTVMPLEGSLGTIHVPRENQFPQVRLLSPLPSASYTAPAAILLEASAADPDGAIRSVDFFAGSTRLSSRTSPPYTATWSGVPVGSYQISAVATDTEGATARTLPITITVRDSLPAAPVNLVASASETTARLEWVDMSTNESGFRLYRSDGSGFALTATVGANVQEHTDFSLQPGRSYTYRLCAFNTSGDSAAAEAVISTSSLPPLPPANVTASPGSGAIIVSWSSSAGAGQYQVQRSLDPAAGFATLYTTGTNTYSDVAIVAGVTYFYRVIAQANGLSSQPSAVVTAMLAGNPPAAPSGLKASAASKTQITLTWRDNSSNESNFVVERSNDGLTFDSIVTLPPNTSKHVDGTVAPRRRYYYRIQAVNSSGPTYSPAVIAKTR